MRTHTKTFHIRFTEKEYDRLCRCAEESGLPKTTYIRHMINGCCPQEKPPKEFWEFMRELHHVGNNLNQLTHLAHRFGSLHAAKLDEMTKQYIALHMAIMKKLYSPIALDVPATLEKGRLIAEIDQTEEVKTYVR